MAIFKGPITAHPQVRARKQKARRNPFKNRRWLLTIVPMFPIILVLGVLSFILSMLPEIFRLVTRFFDRIHDRFESFLGPIFKPYFDWINKGYEQ